MLVEMDPGTTEHTVMALHDNKKAFIPENIHHACRDYGNLIERTRSQIAARLFVQNNTIMCASQWLDINESPTDSIRARTL